MWFVYGSLSLWGNTERKGTMIMNGIKEKVRQKAMEMGAIDVGWADLEAASVLAPDGFKQALCIVVPLNRGVISHIQETPTHAYYAHYVSVNRLIDDITLQLALLLEAEGYPAQAIPAGPPMLSDDTVLHGLFQHKTTAVLSGMGWIGKSALFLHREYGSGVRLGSVLTTTALPIENKPMESQCGGCRICTRVCPSGAIKGEKWELGMERETLFDALKCDTYINTHHEEIAHQMVCGLCMAHCPFTKGTRKLDESL